MALSVVCLIGLAGLWVFSRFPWAVESAYGGVFPLVVGLQGLLVGWLPFSVAEIILLCLPPAALALVLTAFRAWRRSGLRGLGGWGWPALSVLLTVVTAGYLFWGLNYARPDLRSRLGWEVDTAADQALLVIAGNGLVDLLQRTAPDGGGLDRWDLPAEWRDLDRELRRATEVAGCELGMALVQPPGAVKRVRLSRLMSHFGISGVYFPWTGEANVNVDIPQVQLPHVAAHEKAHQLGIAREDEANFLAFVACLASSDSRVVYSGALFGFRQVDGHLRRVDPEASRSLWERLPASVRDDIREIRDYWRQFEGPLERVAAGVNDRYLRSQGVRSGIRSYSESVQLILSYWKRIPPPNDE